VGAAAGVGAGAEAEAEAEASLRAEAREGCGAARRLSEQAARSERLSKAGRTDEAIYLARAVARGSPYGALGPRLVRTP